MKAPQSLLFIALAVMLSVQQAAVAQFYSEHSGFSRRSGELDSDSEATIRAAVESSDRPTSNSMPRIDSMQFPATAPQSFAKLFGEQTSPSQAFPTRNLKIYLLNASANNPGYSVVPLHTAMKNGSATVAETGSVNELRVTNAGYQPIFVHAGDIMKGGRQDRMSQFDVVIPPGRTSNLASFCIEHGRWSARAAESSSSFGSPGTYSAKTGLHTAANGFVGSMAAAARLRSDQSAVWAEVTNVQNNLSSALHQDVSSRVSRTSLGLTLEHEVISQAQAAFAPSLRDLPSRSQTSVGYMAFVNNQFVAGDVYANHKMFADMWPKLLGARITDALISGRTSSSDRAEANFSGAVKSNRTIDANTDQSSDEAASLVRFQTFDKRFPYDPIHVSIVRK